MKTKNISKLGFIFIILILSLASISVSYSGLTNTIQIHGTVTTHDDSHYLDLAGYWNLDDSGYIAADSSPYGNDGTVYETAWTTGKINGALSFDGVDDYVDCGNDTSLDFSTEDFSISVWIYIRDQWTGGAGSNDNVSVILDKGNR
jgi:hypothetical protein